VLVSVLELLVGPGVALRDILSLLGLLDLLLLPGLFGIILLLLLLAFAFTFPLLPVLGVVFLPLVLSLFLLVLLIGLLFLVLVVLGLVFFLFVLLFVLFLFQIGVSFLLDLDPNASPVTLHRLDISSLELVLKNLVHEWRVLLKLLKFLLEHVLHMLHDVLTLGLALLNSVATSFHVLPYPRYTQLTVDQLVRVDQGLAQ